MGCRSVRTCRIRQLPAESCPRWHIRSGSTRPHPRAGEVGEIPRCPTVTSFSPCPRPTRNRSSVATLVSSAAGRSAGGGAAAMWSSSPGPSASGGRRAVGLSLVLISGYAHRQPSGWSSWTPACQRTVTPWPDPRTVGPGTRKPPAPLATVRGGPAGEVGRGREYRRTDSGRAHPPLRGARGRVPPRARRAGRPRRRVVKVVESGHLLPPRLPLLIRLAEVLEVADLADLILRESETAVLTGEQRVDGRSMELEGTCNK